MTYTYARIDLRDAGYLGTKLGAHTIRYEQPKLPVKEIYRYFTDEKPVPADAVAVETPEAIQKVLLHPRQLEEWQVKAAIRIRHDLIPAEWNVFLSFCDGRFRDDWKVQALDNLFIIPALIKNGEWAEGFSTSSLQATCSDWKRFIGSQKIPFEEAGHNFFINGQDQMGRARQGDRIIRSTIYLMGRSVANEVLSPDQLGPEMCKERIIEAYARLYEMKFLASLTINTSEVGAQLEQLYLNMYREEIQLVNQIESSLV